MCVGGWGFQSAKPLAGNAIGGNNVSDWQIFLYAYIQIFKYFMYIFTSKLNIYINYYPDIWWRANFNSGVATICSMDGIYHLPLGAMEVQSTRFAGSRPSNSATCTIQNHNYHVMWFLVLNAWCKWTNLNILDTVPRNFNTTAMPNKGTTSYLLPELTTCLYIYYDENTTIQS